MILGTRMINNWLTIPTLIVSLAGCSTFQSVGTTASDIVAGGPATDKVTGEKLADGTVTGSDTIRTMLSTVGSDALIVGAIIVVLYYTSDKVVWQTETERLSKEKFRITVRKKTIPYGTGDGQAEQYFKRRAEEISVEADCPDYTVLSYTSSLESTLFMNQRVYEGTIRCRKAS